MVIFKKKVENHRTLVQVVQVARVVRMISVGDMHSENIWFSWSKPSNS